ncbi:MULTISPECIES: amidohydrolase family protein [Kribbella]|uniref:Imidazolonepropionase-like amidohydrolase n=1 Tax=Kribbella pratensis TaxID=2512112 RepID=A0ABY2FSV0_9ACTN|nr:MULTISPECIES: amidohydrolase family protein [Kribbella]TDW95605.1 imidazolonepropionase-like amidohydrolase [Kribbella pratensis]TDW98950.1 imidazolonepropionase-like amidohydrolase [Kribbella sp. VKM Ac-2566]
MTSDQGQPTVFHQVRVLDVRRGRVGDPVQVVVRDGVIDKISPAAEIPARARVVPGEGRTLIPGLIDAHWHAIFASVPLMTALTGDVGFLHIVAAAAARDTLLRGFTTVRDAGGPSLGLKQAIDDGLVPGPRIYPSGAMISQTGGHGDFRARHEIPRGRTGYLSHAELVGAVRIADGVSAVFEAAREQLMLGASQLKLMAGGGVASSYDPLDVTQYTEAELHAAVEAAENWGTYVMVHAYTPRAVQQAIRAGVKCIEHGQLLDDETVELMAENEVWWSLQPFLDDEDAPPVPPGSRPKFEQMVTGTETAYELAKKHDVRLAWGTDTLFDPALATKQGKQLAKMTRWFTPAEVLTMATVTNAELLSLSAARNPYPGVLGVVEEGALADLILVNGNPLDDIQLLATPETAFAAIMKQGALVKDTTADSSR